MIPSQLLPLANHLWQSTLFAGIAALLGLLLRTNRPHLRYRLWFLASVKFLIPFSILVALGGQFSRHTAPRSAPSGLATAAAVSSLVEQVSEPFSTTAPQSTTATQRSTRIIVPLLIFIWTAGVVTLTCRWTLRWWRLRRLVRQASPFDLPIGLPVKTSPAFGEPGVFGIFRPVLLLPDRIWECLTAPELESIVTHELCHVRRRDNLASVIHMAVEALFWFHPLAWWLGARLMEERELACDEEVLRKGGEPRVYAEGILKVCELYLASPLECVSGVTGSGLKRRIEGIMANRTALALNAGKRAVLAAAGLAALAAPIFVGLLNTSSGRAQTGDAPAQKFEVASVKVCKEEPNTGNQRRPEFTVSPGRAEIQCLTLERIVYHAYAGIGSLTYPLLNDDPQNDTHVRGGPGWIRLDKYTIEAKAVGTPDRTVMMGPMLRALLEERFKLKLHRETEEVVLFALTVAKGGLKIQPLGEGGCTSREAVQALSPEEIMALNRGPKPLCGNFTATGDGVNRRWSLGGTTLDRLANRTLSSVLDNHVTDKTGVTGLFNVRLEFGLDESIRPNVFGGGRAEDPPPPGIEKGPSIFVALEQQLGLKLEKTRGPREYLLIDHVERPSQN